MLKNKFIFAVAAASAMMLGSCSSSEDLEPLAQPQAESEVEIKLSATDQTASASVSTRAAILGDDKDNVANIEGLGVFGLARKALDVNKEPNPTINWFTADGKPNWPGCILDNVEANKEGSKIKWTNNNVYFYPITQFYAYDFYAYYPYNKVTDLTYGTNTVSASMVIDGTDDVIWGRTASDDAYAYSAKYFREDKDAKATLKLYHMLTRLVFKIAPGEDTKGSKNYESALKMRVDSIYVLDAMTNLKLVIANLDRDNAHRSDFIINQTQYDNKNLNAPNATNQYLTAREDILETLWLRSTDPSHPEYLFDLKTLNSELENMKEMDPDAVYANYGTQVGESFMLYPQTVYTLRIVLSMSLDDLGDVVVDGNTGGIYKKGNRVYFHSESPLKLKWSDSEINDDPNRRDDFRRSYSYNIRVNIHGPHNISLDAELEKWKETEGPTIEL